MIERISLTRVKRWNQQCGKKGKLLGSVMMIRGWGDFDVDVYVRRCRSINGNECHLEVQLAWRVKVRNQWRNNDNWL